MMLYKCEEGRVPRTYTSLRSSEEKVVSCLSERCDTAAKYWGSCSTGC
jgi:hypothetical protein